MIRLTGVLAALVTSTLILSRVMEHAALASPRIQKPGTTEKMADEKADQKKMRVQVIAPDRTPVAGASLTLGIWYQQTANTLHFTTDENGLAELPIPNELRIFRLSASAAGYTPLFAGWEENEIKSGTHPPEEFTFQMIPAVEIGGIFVDENDQPIKGVAVEVKLESGGQIDSGRIRFNTFFAARSDALSTDENGRWSLANIPPGDDLSLSLKVTHPDFVSDEKWGELQSNQSIEYKEFRNKSAKFVLRKGLKIRGTITDESGRPVNDALVVWGDNPYGQEGIQELYVNSDGTYETPTQKNGELRITAIAPGFAPETTMVTVGPDMKSTDFVISPGKRLEIHFVDEAGKPVRGVAVSIDRWRKSKALYNNAHPSMKSSGIPNNCDDDGVFVWDWAPDDAVTYNFNGREMIYQSGVSLTASDEPITIVVHQRKIITGRVSDSDGNPLKSFAVTLLRHLNEATEIRESLVNGKDGEFEVPINRLEGTFSLRIEAAGFEPFFTEKFERDLGAGPFDVKLKPATLIPYQVINEDGKPVPDATVIVVSPDERLFLQNGFFDKQEISETINFTTDSNGFFSLNKSTKPQTLMAISRDGYAEIADYPEQPANPITIRQWASLKGFVTKEGQPWKTKSFIRQNRYLHGKTYHIDRTQLVNADGNGRFQLERVASMPNVIYFVGGDDPLEPQYNIAFCPNPGEEFQLDFANCTRLSFRTKFVGGNAQKVGLPNSLFSLTRLEASVALPNELLLELQANNLDRLGLVDTKKWFVDHKNSHALQAYSSCFDHYEGRLSSTGGIALDVLRPGKYLLEISAYAKTNGTRHLDSMSAFSQEIQIGEEPTDLGEMEIPLFEDPKFGETIADFQIASRTDQSQTSLSAYRGRYVVLDFWCPWCEACGEDTPRVQMLAKSLGKNGKTTIISLMKNGKGPVVRVPVEIPDGITWIDGQVPASDESPIRRSLGVWTTQHFVLIDPDGKYVVGGSLAVVANGLEELALK